MIDSKRTFPMSMSMVKHRSSPESMSVLTSSIGIDKTPTRMTPGAGTLFDRISTFSNEKKNGRRSSTSTEKSSYSLSTIHQPDDSLARSPLRDRLETTVLDVGNIVHSPKRNDVSSASVSFLDCAITPIKRRDRTERSINTSKTISLTSSEGEVSKNTPDEWREVVDPESGRSYFYNRRTRVSKWKLPKGALLRQMRNNTSFVSAVTDVTTESVNHLQISEVQGRGEISSKNAADSKETESDEQSLSNHASTNNADGGTTTTTITAALQSVSPKNILAHVTSGTVTASQFKSPQDTTISTPSLFCLYCGVKTTSLQALESHLNQCSSFIKIQQEPDLLSTQMHLEGLLFSVWSKIGSNGKPSTTGVSGSYELFQSPFKYDDSRGVDEGGDYKFSPPKYNVREHSSKANDDDCIEKKTCPFCDETLVGGDQFSSHLLVCKERKRRRNMRRTPKKHIIEESSPRFRTPRTPGRRMPWER